MGNKKKTNAEFIRKQLNEKPVANDRLYKEVASETRFSPKEVEEMVGFTTKFTAQKIKDGAFETVMISSFGKFRVKPKHVQALNSNKLHE